MFTAFQRALLGAVAVGALLIALVVSAKGSSGATTLIAPGPGPNPMLPPGVVTTGEGTVKVRPDVALLSVGVTVQAATAADAQTQNAERMARVIARAKQLGVADKDTKTSGYSIQPQYSYEPGRAPRITGYQATEQLSLVIRDVAATGRALDALVQNDAATNVSVRFALGEARGAQAEARRLAVEDAKAKAEAMAKAAGVRIAGVISVVEQGQPGPGPLFEFARSGAPAPAKASELPAGELDVVVRVQVQFAIG